MRGKWPVVDDLLLADPAPAWHFGRIVFLAGVAVQHVARAILGAKFGIGRIRIPIRIGQRVEVIQIAVELIEAVDGRQVLVQIAQMVLAELAGGVAQRFEGRGQGAGLGRQANVAPAWPTVVRPVPAAARR